MIKIHVLINEVGILLILIGKQFYGVNRTSDCKYDIKNILIKTYIFFMSYTVLLLLD